MKKMEKYQFGFGCMRLPLLNADDVTSFDFSKTEQLFDAYLNFGFTYFDTAYTYHGYQCEKAVRKALVERHPRSAFELATKMPLRDFKDTADLETILKNNVQTAALITLITTFCITWAPMYMKNAANTERLILLLPKKRKVK